MANRPPLSAIRIVFIVSGALGMFAGFFLYSNAVYYPALDRFCAASCEETNMRRATVGSGYTASSIMENCLCENPAADARPVEYREGYFFTSIAAIDWFLLVLFRLIPIAVISGVAIFIIAKIVTRLP